MEPARLRYYPPEAPARDAVIVICPGGGYRYLSGRESAPIAHAFARLGYHAYVAEYTVDRPPLGFGPVRELAAALIQVREAAPGCGYSAEKIVLCGFSAGGHLCATLGVYWNDPEVTGLAAGLPCRPAGMILAYPVITMQGAFSHPGSRAILTGDEEALVEAFSLERHVSGQTPPAFIWNTFADEKVPLQNSLLFVQAMAAAGVPCEYHLYAKGLHGMSLATPEVESPEEGLYPDRHIAGWMEQCAFWLEETVGA